MESQVRVCTQLTSSYQLGIPGTETKTQPMLIPLKNVKTLALGRYHTIALTEDDNVYAFGQNRYEKYTYINNIVIVN
jgi:alpha-tubulin suppressor-like RCC1 family protein